MTEGSDEGDVVAALPEPWGGIHNAGSSQGMLRREDGHANGDE